MPVYEYECNQCGEIFEVIQRFNDPPATVCKSCGGFVKKLLSPSAFVLKGTGWYVTDYPSESRKKAMESEKLKAGAKEKKSDAGKPVEVKS